MKTVKLKNLLALLLALLLMLALLPSALAEDAPDAAAEEESAAPAEESGEETAEAKEAEPTRLQKLLNDSFLTNEPFPPSPFPAHKRIFTVS